ncbi:16327_t:CDS:2, partial [Cetraspora pellucida]
MKLLTRNVNLQLTPNPYTRDFQKSNNECYDELIRNFSGIPLEFLAGNNVIFIVFHIWQLYLFFNAVFHEHSIQIVTICFFNFGWLFFGLVQGLELKFPLNQLHNIKACVGKTDFDPSFWTNDIPFLWILILLTAISTWFSLKLYKQFGWNIYKKIGGDVKMR